MPSKVISLISKFDKFIGGLLTSLIGLTASIIGAEVAGKVSQYHKEALWSILTTIAGIGVVAVIIFHSLDMSTLGLWRIAVAAFGSFLLGFGAKIIKDVYRSMVEEVSEVEGGG